MVNIADFEWIIGFETVCKKRKEKQQCIKRDIPVESCYQCDLIWIIWDTILYYGKLKGIFITKILSSLLQLFCIKYTTSLCKKRRYILYFAVSLLIENVSTDIDIVVDKLVIQSVLSQINNVYKEIKKGEISKLNYTNLYEEDKKTNIEKSIRKLEIVDKIDIK